MIVEHRTSKKQYTLTPEAWGKIVASGKRDAYKIIEAPEPPKELKTVRPAKAEKAEINNNGIESTDPGHPVEDPGENT